VWWPTYHFERLLEEACPNNTYTIKHRLKDYDMMKNFMTSGSLIWDRELKEESGRRGVIPFPREDAVTMVYDGCSPPGRHHVSNSSPRTPTHCG
jgi:hypothetical protein